MVQQCLNDSEREFFAEVSTCFTPDQPALHRINLLYTAPTGFTPKVSTCFTPDRRPGALLHAAFRRKTVLLESKPACSN
jgi:hypothetical protein